MTVVPTVAWRLDALLGEGPAWIAHEQALRFVDIKRGKLHRYHPASGACETLDVGGSPSFILPERGGTMLVGSGSDILRLTGSHLGGPVATIPQARRNRTNDATVDPDGRLWFGTMDDLEELPTGAIWCLGSGSLRRLGGDAVVTNGPAVSTDGQTLYHVDSGERIVWRFPIGPGPVLGGGEVFLRFAEAEGFPDGVTIDSENCLWVALWDGWAVRRYSPDGALLLHIDFPCARVTKVAFGGADLATGYVTSARIGLDNEALTAQPFAGSLFSFAAPAPGLIVPVAHLE